MPEMPESPLIKSLREGIPRTPRECSVPSNLAYRQPVLHDSTPFAPLGSPRSDDQAIHDHAPHPKDLRSTNLLSRAHETTLPPSAYRFDFLGLIYGSTADNHASLFGAINLETLRTLGSQGFDLALLARFASRITRTPAESNKVILPVESAETEDIEDWLDLGDNI